MYKHTDNGTVATGYLATRPTMIITTKHENGIVNAGVFGAYTNLSPTHVGIAISQLSHTYANIIRDKKFAINIPGADLAKSISVIASKIPESSSEIEEAGLTEKSDCAFEIPTIAECQAAVFFSFRKELTIGHHNFVTGEATGGWIRRTFIIILSPLFEDNSS